MNYAALLAVIAVLAFAFPVLVRVAAAHGFAQAWAVLAALGGMALAIAWYQIRGRVAAHAALNATVQAVRARVAERPDDPAAFLAGREHLGDLLVRLDRPEEAVAAFDQEASVLEAAGLDAGAVRARRSRLLGEAAAGRERAGW